MTRASVGGHCSGNVTYRPDHRHTLEVEGVLAQVDDAVGDYTRCVERATHVYLDVLEDELAAQTDTTEPRHALRVAEAEGVCARALWELGSDRERAVELVREALEALKAGLPFEAQRIDEQGERG